MKSNLKFWMLLAIDFAIMMCITLMLFGCKSTHYIPVETVRTDSMVIRDTSIVVQLVPYRDSVSVADTTSFLSNPYAYSRAIWSGGMLHHVLGIWPRSTAMVKVPYFIDRYRYIREPQIVEVEKKLTRWQRIKLELGGWAFGGIILFALIIVGWLVFKRRKR